jgi:glutathione synthase/RimK-type ligase-like ATP-grasp enzyme
MFQKFIDKSEEFRVLVLGDTIGSYERKTSTDPNEFRNNVSLGASEEFINMSEISEAVKYVSLKASKVLNIQVGGVDVVIDTQGKIWLLEVNRGPGFTYNSDKSPEMDSVADYFKRSLSKAK